MEDLVTSPCSSDPDSPGGLNRARLLDQEDLCVLVPETPSPQRARRPRRRRVAAKRSSPAESERSSTKSKRQRLFTPGEDVFTTSTVTKVPLKTPVEELPSVASSSSSSPSSSPPFFLTAEERRWLLAEQALTCTDPQAAICDGDEASARLLQMEEDEAFARSLQEQFEREEVEFHSRNLQRPPPCQNHHRASGELSGDAVTRELSPWEIKQFPTKHFESAHGGERTKCHICFGEYNDGDKLRMLPCFHDYHIPCIDHWLTKHVTCPICRADLRDLAMSTAPP